MISFQGKVMERILTQEEEEEEGNNNTKRRRRAVVYLGDGRGGLLPVPEAGRGRLRDAADRRVPRVRPPSRGLPAARARCRP
jgi:hypothetical protein